MIVSHASGICACTYHLFYNNPELNWIVNLQAGLTTLGNAALALAAYRIYDFEQKRIENNAPVNPVVVPLLEDDATFWISTFVKSLVFAGIVKYGELFFDFPFTHDSRDALAIITIPVLLNIAKWSYRSSGQESSEKKNWIL